jgi:hypothetical protein
LGNTSLGLVAAVPCNKIAARLPKQEGKKMTLLDWGLIALGVSLMALAAWGGAKMLWWKS